MNIIRHKKSYLVILAIAAIISCKKNEPQRLLGRFETTSDLSVLPAVMLTSNGTINDQMFIQAYLTRHQHTDGFIFGTTTSWVDEHPLAIDFKENNQAIVTPYPQSAPSVTRLFEVTGNTSSSFVLGGYDSTNILILLNMNRCEQYVWPLLQVHFPPVCSPLSSSTGYKEVCKTRSAIPINRIGDDIYIPIFTFDITRNDGNISCWYKSRFERATVNSSLSVKSGDTIVYQPSLIKLIRK
ncbi:hypothetical protein [Chitinophaga nivalis]|uniref:Lipoprotein n=1 Tax=Chitinophaga nivalis TaxID=2991709 RepID=A0ABT3IKG2_9BACT|nr:hypothetical protein [Chitinophaga nivalis]MCW3465855.1 hypothetical protein [Chitinophaga nivalis]MCW3484454.1 hypothetical protein [Chitinophaga nivalis]